MSWQLNIEKKFVVSLSALAMLALAGWLTLSNDPVLLRDSFAGIGFTVRFRSAVFAILGAFAVLTSLAFWRAKIEEKRASQRE